MFKFHSLTVSNIRGVDNAAAVALTIAQVDNPNAFTLLKDSTFSGSGTNTQQQRGSTAIRLPVVVFGSKKVPPGTPMLPWYKIKSEGSWGQSHSITGCTFYGFTSSSAKLFDYNPTNADY